MNGPYDDMLELPHHVSATRPHMKPEERAAQFAPFAALTGYGDAIEETVRLTDEKQEMGEDALERLNRKLLFLTEHVQEHPDISVTYFKPDVKKDGGSYHTASGSVAEIDLYRKRLTLKEQNLRLLKIPISDILEISGTCMESV